MKAPCLVRLVVCLFALSLGGLLAADPVSYTVKKGDTLYGIALDHDCSLDELLKANHLKASAAIKVGQKLQIPVMPVAVSTKTENYRIQKGDTLYGIARSHGLSLKELVALNKISEKTPLKVGQSIKLPLGAKAIAQAGPAPEPSPRASPEAKASPPPDPSPKADPDKGESVVTVKSAEKASGGTILKPRPYAAGAQMSWPIQGERFLVDGKIPGVLIKADKGTVIKAVSNGKVIYSQPHATFGHTVFVQNESGFIYIYGGNDSSVLVSGDQVKSGDPIGMVGNSPGFPDSGAFFSTWKDGAYIDPSAAPRG